MLKLLKMATGMRALLDTVVQALPQVGRQLGGWAWVWLPCSQGGHHRHPQEDRLQGGPHSLSVGTRSPGRPVSWQLQLPTPLPAGCKE